MVLKSHRLFRLPSVAFASMATNTSPGCLLWLSVFPGMAVQIVHIRLT